MISGWKTLAGAAALALLGIVDIANGDIEQGMAKISAAVTAYGVAHKVEKNKK